MSHHSRILAADKGGNLDRLLFQGSRILFCYLTYRDRFQTIFFPFFFKGLLLLSWFSPRDLISLYHDDQKPHGPEGLLRVDFYVMTITVPQRYQDLVPGTCECHLIYKKKFFAVVIKLKMLR